MDDIFLELVARLRRIAQGNRFAARGFGLVDEDMTALQSGVGVHLVIIGRLHKLSLHSHIAVNHLENIVIRNGCRLGGILLADHTQVAKLETLIWLHNDRDILSGLDQTIRH